MIVVMVVAQRVVGGGRKVEMDLANYILSLPERVLRSMSALAGGLLREISDVSVPAAVRRSRTYQTMVEATLRFLIEQVGQVDGTYGAEGRLASNFAMRRAAGNGIELLGLIAFRASPVWVMAVLADLSGAGRDVVRDISRSLQEEGLLASGESFETVDQMLDGFERSAGRIAETINTPPLDVAGLRQEWKDLRQEFSSIPNPGVPASASIARSWNEMREEAKRQQRTVFEVSSLLALSAVARLPEDTLKLSRGVRNAAGRASGRFSVAILDHYRDTLSEIHEKGYLDYWIEAYRPYLAGAAEQFSPRRISWTERLFRRARLARR